MLGQGTHIHTHTGRKVCNGAWYMAGDAVVVWVETMPQPEKSDVSSHVFRKQWKNTEICSSILL